MIRVTTTDFQTGEQEMMDLDGLSHILILNQAEGYYRQDETVYADGTIVITIKRRGQVPAEETV